MKKIGWFVLIFSIFSCKPKRQTIPDFNLLGIDSTTIFNTKDIPKGKPVILVYFSPDCESCQEETQDWIKNINALKDARFYFIANDPLSRIRLFNEVYRIYKYPNMKLGQDYKFGFIRAFKPSGTPYLIVCNKNKELRFVFPGGTKTDTLKKVLESL